MSKNVVAGIGVGIESDATDVTFSLDSQPNADTVFHQPEGDSETFFQILNAAGDVVLNIDSVNGIIQALSGATSNSSESKFEVLAVIDDTGAGSAHGFSDSSDINRSGGIGYNSFDARIDFIGTQDYNHYVSFQCNPSYGSTGTMTNMYGVLRGRQCRQEQ